MVELSDFFLMNLERIEKEKLNRQLRLGIEK